MPVDQNLSNFSDIAVQTAFVIYIVALFMSLMYYGRMKSLLETRRAAQEEKAKGRKENKELAAVGAGSLSLIHI